MEQNQYIFMHSSSIGGYGLKLLFVTFLGVSRFIKQIFCDCFADLNWKHYSEDVVDTLSSEVIMKRTSGS